MPNRKDDEIRESGGGRNANSYIWNLAMVIIAALGTAALFMASMGYNSVERRLCTIEAKMENYAEKIGLLEINQRIRLDRERIEREKR